MMTYSTIQIREKAVNAYLSGEKVSNIAKMLCAGRTTVYDWLTKFNETKSVERKINPGSGRPSTLTNHHIASIIKIIKSPASQYGFDTDLWTIRRIINVAKKKLQLVISKTTMHRILCDKDQSYKKTEQRYYEADKKTQDEWLKKIVPEIKRCVKKNNAILYFEDEANVSLVATVGKTWGPIGQKTIIKRTGNRGGVSAISAITKSGNLIFNLHEKRISSVEIIQFLQQMLEHHPRRHLVVVMNQAKPHVSKITMEFIASQKRLHIYYLPARSPEFNPDEKVWNHLKNEDLKAHQATNVKELKTLTRKKLKKMANSPSLLKGIFHRCEIASLF